MPPRRRVNGGTQIALSQRDPPSCIALFGPIIKRATDSKEAFDAISKDYIGSIDPRAMAEKEEKNVSILGVASTYMKVARRIHTDLSILSMGDTAKVAQHLRELETLTEGDDMASVIARNVMTRLGDNSGRIEDMPNLVAHRVSVIIDPDEMDLRE